MGRLSNEVLIRREQASINLSPNKYLPYFIIGKEEEGGVGLMAFNHQQDYDGWIIQCFEFPFQWVSRKLVKKKIRDTQANSKHTESA